VPRLGLDCDQLVSLYDPKTENSFNEMYSYYKKVSNLYGLYLKISKNLFHFLNQENIDDLTPILTKMGEAYNHLEQLQNNFHASAEDNQVIQQLCGIITAALNNQFKMFAFSKWESDANSIMQENASNEDLMEFVENLMDNFMPILEENKKLLEFISINYLFPTTT